MSGSDVYLIGSTTEKLIRIQREIIRERESEEHQPAAFVARKYPRITSTEHLGQGMRLCDENHSSGKGIVKAITSSWLQFDSKRRHGPRETIANAVMTIA
jgi:hypothetical protein